MLAINIWSKKDSLVLSYRDETGRLRFKYPPKEYTAFMRALPPGLMRDAAIIDHRKEGDWYRLIFRDYDARLAWLGRNAHLDVYEGDVSPVKRLMADNDIQVQRGRRCYIDIETDPRVPVTRAIIGDAFIIMWSVVDDEGNEYQGILENETDQAECELLKQLFAVLAEYDQVAGWNLDGFDKPVIEERAKRYRMYLDRRLLFVDHMLAFKRMNLQTAASGEEKQSFALGNVAQAILGEGKDDYNVANTYDDWKAGGDRLAKLAAYNMKDAKLLPAIEAATGFLEAFQTICEVCNCFPHSHNLKPTGQMDGYLLRMAREEGTHLPTRYDREEEGQFEGAYVMPPTKRGILEGVSVFDFGSLYPSTLITWNMSFDTKVGPEYTGPVAVVPETGIRFRTDFVGVIPRTCLKFIELRAVFKKRKAECVPNSDEWKSADRSQSAYKTLINSLYGLIGSPFFRLHDREIATSVTAAGRWCLKEVQVASCE